MRKKRGDGGEGGMKVQPGCTQHYSLFQIATCLLWRQMALIKDVFHPGTCDLEIVHVLHTFKIAHACYAISGF